jgi:hypothetical protein
MRLDDVIDQVAASQHACIAIWQLRDLGASPTEITRLRQSRHWRALSRRVLVRTGAPATSEQRACAAVLEAGPQAALASFSAGALWRLGTRYQLLPACVMANRPAASFAGEIGHVYPRRGIPARWITTHLGIAVVRPELCIYQLAGLVHPGQAERALDTGLSMGLVTVQSMRDCHEELAEHGRNGTVVLRTLLAVRPIGFTPVATGLEGRFEQVIGTGWRRQVDSGGEMWAGRVDFRHLVYPVIIEVQSERYHSSLSSRRDDEIRREKLVRAGFIVAEVWDRQLWHAPDEARAIARGALLQAPRHAS